MFSKLQKAVIRLAEHNPQLRPHLIGALGTDVRVAVGVSSRTQVGFDTEFRPELDRLASGGVSRSRLETWGVARLREAFSTRDPLYLSLILHQASYESEAQFLSGLERALQQWAREA